MKFLMPTTPYAVTFYCDRIPPQLISKVEIFSNGNSPKTVNALWDTGATTSCISDKLVNELQLLSIKESVLNTASGRQNTFVYGISIRIAEKFSVSNVNVNCAKLDNNFDIIIGMDIIGQGDLSVGSTNNGKYMISYRVPSRGVEDYVQVIRRQNVVGQSHKAGKHKKKR